MWICLKKHVNLHKWRSDTHQIPSPGGRVAPKGSGEECGRKPDMQYNMSGLLKGRMRNETLQQVCTFQIIERCRPISSSVSCADS